MTLLVIAQNGQRFLGCELALERYIALPSHLHEQRWMDENILIPIGPAPIRSTDHTFSRHRIVVATSRFVCRIRPILRPRCVIIRKSFQAAIIDASGTHILACYTHTSTTPLVWVVAHLSGLPPSSMFFIGMLLSPARCLLSASAAHAPTPPRAHAEWPAPGRQPAAY